MIDIVELTVAKAEAAFANGEITSEALTRAFLDRIAIYNPRYNAIIFFDAAALDDAWAIDRRRAAGETLGPLTGIPVVVKDTMDMARPLPSCACRRRRWPVSTHAASNRCPTTCSSTCSGWGRTPP